MASPLEVDLRTSRTARDVHVAFSRALSFPDWYGHNWDAFWDCISSDWPLPQRLILVGLGYLERMLPREATLLLQCLGEYNTSGHGNCRVETDDDYDGIIDFVAIEVVPAHPQVGGTRGAIAKCWIKRTSQRLAAEAATTSLVEEGWTIVSVGECRTVTIEDYPKGSDGRSYFKQACVDGAVFGIHTWDCAGEALRQR